MRVALTTAHFVMAATPYEYAWCQAFHNLGDLTLFTASNIGKRARNVPQRYLTQGLRDEETCNIKINKLPSLIDLNGENPYLLGLKKELRKEPFDLFHTTDFYRFISLETAAVARKQGKPFVFTAHRYEAPQSRLARAYLRLNHKHFQKKIFDHTDHIMAVAPRSRQYILENFRFPADRISILPQPIITNLFKPTATVPGQDRILSIGRLEKVKGHRYLIEAAHILKKRGVYFELKIIGRGSLEDDLRHRIKTLNLSDRVSIDTDYIWFQDLPGIYSQADIFAMPSLTEVGGTTALESMSCGLPIVASKTGGLTLAVKHQQNGLLAKPGNAKDLAAQIELLLKNPDDRKRLGQAARQTVLNHFDARQVAKQYHDIYQKVIKEYKSHARS